jgi:hypothetical protein
MKKYHPLVKNANLEINRANNNDGRGGFDPKNRRDRLKNSSKHRILLPS